MLAIIKAGGVSLSDTNEALSLQSFFCFGNSESKVIGYLMGNWHSLSAQVRNQF